MRGSLETLELLMCLNRKRFTTSSEIRRNLRNLKGFNLNTLNSRLDRLTKQELILKKDKGGKLKPGGDKIEYKLTKDGNDLIIELKEKAKNIIIADPNIKKAMLKEALKEEDNIVDIIISEYSQELGSYFEGKELTLRINRLRTIINKLVI